MANGKYIVTTIGGGTGSSTLLRGLRKRNDLDLAAIVAMTDDGGSTGRLRDELGIPPVGDIRQCLTALAEKESLWRRIFNLRFDDGKSLQGHSVGNLILAALEKDCGLEEAIEIAEQVLYAKGKVIPVTFDNFKLYAETKNGGVIRGEHEIDIKKQRLRRVYFSQEPTLNPAAAQRIICSDLIVVCPGDIYTSILPVLLVKGVTDTLVTKKGHRVYVCNLMTQQNHTDGFTIFDFVERLEFFTDRKLFDFVLYNTQRPAPDFLKNYLSKGESFVEPLPEINTIRNDTIYLGYDLLHEVPVLPVAGDTLPRTFIRHHPEKVAQHLYDLVCEIKN